MAASRYAWLLNFWRQKPIDQLSSREIAIVRSCTRSLIHVANKIDLERSISSDTKRRPASDSYDLSRYLTIAEKQLTTSIADAASHRLSVGDLEHQVIGPILQSTAIVSELAYEVVERAVRSATHDAHARP